MDYLEELEAKLEDRKLTTKLRELIEKLLILEDMYTILEDNNQEYLYLCLSDDLKYSEFTDTDILSEFFSRRVYENEKSFEMRLEHYSRYGYLDSVGNPNLKEELKKELMKSR